MLDLLDAPIFILTDEDGSIYEIEYDCTLSQAIASFEGKTLKKYDPSKRAKWWIWSTCIATDVACRTSQGWEVTDRRYKDE